MHGAAHLAEKGAVFVAQLLAARVVLCVVAKRMEHVGIKRDKVEESLAPDRKGGVAEKLAYCLAGSALEVADVIAEWLGKVRCRDDGSVEKVGHYLELLLFEKWLFEVEPEPFFSNYLAKLV